MLDRHQHRAAPFAAEAKALHETAADQQDRRPDAGRVVGRKEADHGGGRAHDQQREIEHRLAADLVAVMAEHQPAERPRDEAERIGRKRQQRADHRIEGGKEQLVEDQRRGGAVKKEVIPFDGGADQARRRHRDVRRLRVVSFQRDAHVVPPMVDCVLPGAEQGPRQLPCDTSKSPNKRRFPSFRVRKGIVARCQLSET